jgi:alkylation response protein AidB-like acyl-CoA dehydrogenase
MAVLNSLELVAIPPEDEALRAEIKAFLAAFLPDMPADKRARSWQGFNPEFSRALGRAGFIGLSLPKDYGGGERGPFARFVVLEELLAVGAPVAAHWIADRQSAQLLLRYGNEAQRQKHLPAICRGEEYFCIGMSEPGSGSDLASVRSRAVQQVDGSWRLNGAKIWTSNAHFSHYMIALVRTSGEPADKHRGLSQILIDLSLPGITIKPIVDISGDAHFCELHFDNVQLPPDAIIGNEGEGWHQVTAELVLERSGPERIYSSLVLLDGWVRQLQTIYGKSESEPSQAILIALGEMIGELAVLRSMSLAVTACLARGESPAIEATLIKDLGTSFEQRIPERIIDLAGSLPDEQLDGGFLRTLFYVAQVAPSFSLRGGTREILRGIIAKGLGLRKEAAR